MVTRGQVILEPWLLCRKIVAISPSCPSPSSQGSLFMYRIGNTVGMERFGSHLPVPRRRKDNERRRSDGIQIEM